MPAWIARRSPTRAFALALQQRDPGARPAGLIGLEHEFSVAGTDGPEPYAHWLWRATVDGRPLDPADPHAHRLRTGAVLTIDGAEAEASIPPEPLAPGFTQRLAANASRNAQAVRATVPIDRAVRGFSTHISLSMPGRAGDAVARAYLPQFGPDLMLLMDGRDSPGLLSRPRAGRLELGAAFVAGEQLRGVAAFAAASARALAGTKGARHASPGRRHLPPRLAGDFEPAVQRYGWFADARSTWPDLLSVGREARLMTEHGRAIRAQDHLEWAWTAVRPEIERQVSSGDLDAADRMVAGALPLPCEMGIDAPGMDPAIAAWISSEDPLRSPFGAMLDARRRSLFWVAAEIATWDFTIFRIWNRVRRGYACVPRRSLAAFLDLLDDGSLDRAVISFLGSQPRGRRLAGWADAHAPGLYDEIGPSWAFVAPERDQFGAPLAFGPGAAGRKKARRPREPGGIRTNGHEFVQGRDRNPRRLIGGLLVVLVLLFGGVVLVLGRGPGPTATAPPPTPLAIPSDTAPALVATPLAATPLAATPLAVETQVPVTPVPTVPVVPPPTIAETFATVTPIAYSYTCSGGLTVGCTSLDVATCDRTFGWVFTVLTDPVAHEGQIATIATSGWGLKATYQAPVKGGKIEFAASIRGRDYGGTTKNGCYVAGAHWTAYPTDVGGTPTITPLPPP